MKHVIVGTAGHVDHGKTTLVKAMTGQDTDRLKEEKERGISIDLGFAPLTLPNGEKVGLVDVPGHERFIKNMLAGVGGMDLVLLIIAADEGVMPQTREHLDIIQLLHIPRGIVVITKTDLVDTDWLELVTEEVRDVLKDTILADAPLVPVSAVTGAGIPELLELLEQEVTLAGEKKGSGPFRMAVDRTFSVTGFGTVVTGTLGAGTVKLGDLAELLPSGVDTKIRSIQVHGQKVEEAQAGQRVALNLAGIEILQVKRGDVVATPGTLESSFRLDVEFYLLPGAAKKVENRQRMRLHLGTTEALCRVVLLEREELEPGDTALAQLLVEVPVVGAKHDRFVLRTYSPMHTVGGGVIIDPNPPRHRRNRPDVLASLATKLQGTPDELLHEQLAKLTNRLVSVDEAFSLAGLSAAEGQEALEFLLEGGETVKFPAENKEYLMAREVESLWLKQVHQALTEFHRVFPLRAGLPKEELRSRLFSGIANKLFNHLLQYWEKAGQISIREQAVAEAGFNAEMLPELKDRVGRIVSAFQDSRWQPPDWEEAAEEAGLPAEWRDEVLYFLLGQGTLVKLADDVYFHCTALQAAITEIIKLLEEKKQISLAEVRDTLGSSRKYILPLLEYMDREKITRRTGDLRVKA